MSCWTNPDCYQRMIDSIDKYPVEEVPLGKVLKELIEKAGEGSYLDLGCGTGDASKLINDYTGADQRHIIDNVSLECFPKVKFIPFESWNVEFLQDYDVILMSAFIDVLENPIEALKRIIPNCKKVILHRQEMTHGETKIIQNPSYGGWTYHSLVNWTEFWEAIAPLKVSHEVKLNIDGWEEARSFILD